jgi:hypothetical protein
VSVFDPTDGFEMPGLPDPPTAADEVLARLCYLDRLGGELPDGWSLPEHAPCRFCDVDGDRLKRWGKWAWETAADAALDEEDRSPLGLWMLPRCLHPVKTARRVLEVEHILQVCGICGAKSALRRCVAPSDGYGSDRCGLFVEDDDVTCSDHSGTSRRWAPR